MTPVHILLADDHALVRTGIRSVLESLEGIQVVAEASNGREALRLIAKEQPDVVLIDIAMPELNSLEAAARVAQDFPAMRVIKLSMHSAEDYVLQALRVGAAGYLLKDASATELKLAIRAVVRGDTYLSPAVSTCIADYVRRSDGDLQTISASNPYERLTSRQREVLQLIAEGYKTQEIAQMLNISVKTAEAHRAQLMDRLDIHDVAGLVRYAIRTGLVSLEA